MLQNAYLLAKIGADTAENERKFAEILPKTDNAAALPLDMDGRRAPRRARGAAGIPPRRAAAPPSRWPWNKE